VKAYLPSEKEKNMFSNSFLRQTATTIVFIDASVSDYQTLQTGVVEGVETAIRQGIYSLASLPGFLPINIYSKQLDCLILKVGV
jgi:hypothetical protein